jgi:hypothetical protein
VILAAADALKAPLASPALTGVPTAPTASNGTNTTQLATTAFVLANAGGGGGIGRNFLINASGEIQQYPLGAGFTNGVYDLDQWLTLTQTAAVTISVVNDAENSTPYMMRSLQAQATAQRFGRIQWIEGNNCRFLRGQNAVLSARVRMSAATTLRYAIIEWTGTTDVITKDPVLSWTNTTFTAGNFFKSTTTTIVATGSIALSANTLTDIAPLSGAVSGSMNNLAVMFWTDSAQAQNVTLDIAKVKLELGLAATTYVAPSYADELVRCQRYYQASVNLDLEFNVLTSQGYLAHFPMFVTPRATPSVERTSYTTSAGSGVSFSSVSVTGYKLSFAGGVSGYVRITASAWFNARL